MLPKARKSSLILDRLHKGFVISCIALTFYGGYLLSTKISHYYNVYLPAREALEEEVRNKLKNENNSTASSMSP